MFVGDRNALTPLDCGSTMSRAIEKIRPRTEKENGFPGLKKVRSTLSFQQEITACVGTGSLTATPCLQVSQVVVIPPTAQKLDQAGLACQAFFVGNFLPTLGERKLIHIAEVRDFGGSGVLDIALWSAKIPSVAPRPTIWRS